jgi:hypothetical protein
VLHDSTPDLHYLRGRQEGNGLKFYHYLPISSDNEMTPLFVVLSLSFLLKEEISVF